MADDHSIIIETIVNTLLHVGERVLEISRDLVVTSVWDRENVTLKITREQFLGKKISDIRNDFIFTQCARQIETTFATGKNGYVKYDIVGNDNVLITFGIRILNAHPDKDFVLVVIEKLRGDDTVEYVEDKWKVALDAAGDGVWDINLETRAMYFSEKWLEIFGYRPGDIRTVDEWLTKVHPEDRIWVEKMAEAYLTGASANYSAEIRCRRSDGTYRWVLSRGVVIDRTAKGNPLRFTGTHTDIHNLKIAEEKYLDTTKFLTKLIDNLRCGIFVTDQQFKIVFANQYFCDIYGYKHGPEKLIGEDVREGLEERKTFFIDENYFKARTKEIISGCFAVNNEEWYLRNGRILSRDYVPISLNDGKTAGIWILNDITDQKNTEKRFEEQRNFYEGILNNIKSDIVVLDKNEKFIFINPNGVKNDGVRKMLIGKTDEEYCLLRNKPIEVHRKRQIYLDKAKAEKKPQQWEEKLVTNEGAIEYHLRHLYPVFDANGDIDLFISYGLDITDRILAGEALQTSKDTFASAFNYSAIGMVLISPDGKWIDANNVICELTGFNKDELLQKSFHEITHPDDDDLDRLLIAKMVKNEISTYTIERRYISKKKKIILTSLTVSIVRNSDGTPKFFIAQVIDITQKKALENEISRKHAELEATKVNLINKINQLEQLSHIIAHNLRGPAGNIKMLSDALVQKYKGTVDTTNGNITDAFTEEQILELISESSTALMDSLATLIEITEIKLNKEIPFNDCDVSKIIKDITTQLQGIIYEKGAFICVDLNVQHIKYPKVYLENILYNLVSNSLKYSRKNVVPEIVITTRMQGERIQVIVRDNGLGIDLKKYGEKVFRLNQVFHEGYESKGIGLYITKTQVESLGGNIIVNSRLNEGSEFVVTL